MVLPYTLGYSPRPPVSVFGTDYYNTPLVDFLGGSSAGWFAPKSALPQASRLNGVGFPPDPAYAPRRPNPSGRPLYLPRPHIGQTHCSRPRNIDLVSIDYASRPHLRFRLTLRGLALRRKPWAYGAEGSHLRYRYSCQHSHFRYLHRRSRDDFPGMRNALLPLPHKEEIRSFGGTLSPANFRRRVA